MRARYDEHRVTGPGILTSKFAWLAVLLFALPGARAAEYEGKIVSAVRFETSAQPLTDAELLSISGIVPGRPYRAAAIRSALSRLYETGRFDDIAADATLEGGENGAEGNSVRLTFRLSNRWFVGQQTLTGVREPPTPTQLLNVTKLGLGEPYSEGAMRQAVEQVSSLLRANGFFGARVEVDISREPELEQVNINYRLDTGPRAHFTEPLLRGPTSLTPGDVLRATGWRRFWVPGKFRTVTEPRVQSGLERIRRLLEKKRLLTSRVTLLGLEWKPVPGHAVPSLEISDGPPVDLRISGVKLSRRRTRQLIPVFAERAADNELLSEGARNLAQYLAGLGYFDATTAFSAQESGGRRIISYDVNRGSRYRLKSIAFAGNSFFDRKTLSERLTIIPASGLRYRNGRFSTRLAEADSASIAELYRSNGFLDIRVTPEIAPTPDRSLERAVTIRIEEGRQYRIGRITLEGVDAETAAAIRARMQSAEGQPFSRETVAQDRETILDEYYNAGYTTASLEWETARAADATELDLKLMIRPGPAQTIRSVVIRGIERTNPKLVYSRVTLRPGDPLSLGRILDSQTQLYNLGIFARVETAIQNADGAEQSRIVLFQVEEAKKYSFNAGFGAQVARIGGGVESFDAPAGTTGFSPRVNLSVTRNNFLGLGHSVTLQGRLSNLQQRAQLTYLAPHFGGRDSLSLAVSGLFDQSSDIRTFSAERAEAAGQLTYALSRSNTIQARYTIRQVAIDPLTLKIQPQLIPRLAQPVRVGIVSGTFIQDRRDDPIDSKRGMYTSVDLALAASYLASQSNFVRLLGRNSTYHRIGPDVIFARTVTLGLQERLLGGPLRDVPFPERFFAGGSASHRGFPENQAGPRDPTTGFPIGGKALLMFGHELRYPLVGDNLGAVLFHDMGNVFGSVREVSFRAKQRDTSHFDYMVHAAGVGLRYRTPIGPIRVDVAFSPNSPRFFGFVGTREQLLFGTGAQRLRRISQFQLHFSLGQTF
jgi:outer membrane protein assembly complex protein YaeT